MRSCLAGAVSLRPQLPLKRQWAGAVWGPFFATLLNHTGGSIQGMVLVVSHVVECALATGQDSKLILRSLAAPLQT